MHQHGLCLCPPCVARDTSDVPADEHRAVLDSHAAALFGRVRIRERVSGLVPHQVTHGVVRFRAARAL